MSRDTALNMPITAIVVDEVQVPLEDRTPLEVQGKKIAAGEYIGELLTWLAKKGPAAGVVLILATQRPDSKTIPSGLRAVLGSRLALRVMDWRDSNIVLGEQMNTRGYDASRLLPTHKGVGILRPDGEAADALALTVRTDYMPNDDWRTLCERARVLREQEGTLTGHAAGQDTTPQLTHTPRIAIGPAVSSALPEPLASVSRYVDEHGDGREFIPTAELVDALDIDPTSFGRQMGEQGCAPRRMRIGGDQGTRQVRGYVVADVRRAVTEWTGS